MPLNLTDKIPMRWPSNWGPAQYRKLPASRINCLVVDQPDPAMVSAYAADGIAVMSLREAAVSRPEEARWAQVQTSSQGADADSGPTGVPWVNSNGYLIQAVRALQPEQPVWLDSGPPKGQASPTTDVVRLAICDAAAYGGKWIIRPDLADWKTLKNTVDFFAQRQGWLSFRPIGYLAVVASFSGSSRASSLEILNMLTRRLIPFVILPEARALDANLAAFRAVLQIDALPSSSPLGSKLAGFTKQGGMLIRPASDDPYQVAVETHLKLSRRNDLIRLWNGASMNASYTAASGGRKHLVQVLNYAASNPSMPVTLGLAHSYRAAQVVTLDHPKPEELRITKVRAGIELELPPFPVYAAIELTPGNAP